jgi:hypothetical protein
MLVDEKELDMMLHALWNDIKAYPNRDETFDATAKVYVKLLEEKESIQRERAKHETESI